MPDGGIDAGKLARQAAHDAIAVSEGVTPDAAQVSTTNQQGAEQPASREGASPDRPFRGVEQVRDQEVSTQPGPDFQEAPSEEALDQLEEDLAAPSGERDGDQIYQDLLDLGIDLGVPPSEIKDPDTRERYFDIAEQVAGTVLAARNEAMQAVQARMQMDDFARRLQESPDKLLLLMGLKHPDVFKETMATFERMQEDEREKELVLRELQADAMYAAAERQKQASKYGETLQHAQRVTNATHRLARKMGIPIKTAEEWVARDVNVQLHNGRYYGVEDVPRSLDALRESLAGFNRPLRTRRERVASQETLEKQKTADTLPTEGAGAPVQPRDERDGARFGSRGTENMSAVRRAVHDAFSRNR